jgi:hypothetical protein
MPARGAYPPDIPESRPAAPGAPSPPPDPEYRDVFTRLLAPFSSAEVHQRQQAGRTLSYITARTVANRLDEVLGPLGWKAEFREVQNGVICKLSIRIGGEWYAKEDAGGLAALSDQGDNTKAGFSDALKRAAAMWGVGRYLYGSGVPSWAQSAFAGDEGRPHRRDAQPARRAPPAVGGHRPPPRDGSGRDERQPATGPALYAWARRMGEGGDDEYEYVNRINQIVEDEELAFPRRMADWSPAQVAAVWSRLNGAKSAPGETAGPDKPRTVFATVADDDPNIKF